MPLRRCRTLALDGEPALRQDRRRLEAPGARRPARSPATRAGTGRRTRGQARTRSTATWEREYGVFTLLREAPRAPAIEASRYLWLVRTLPPAGRRGASVPGLGAARDGGARRRGRPTCSAISIRRASPTSPVRRASSTSPTSSASSAPTESRRSVRPRRNWRPTAARGRRFVMIDPFDEGQRPSTAWMRRPVPAARGGRVPDRAVARIRRRSRSRRGQATRRRRRRRAALARHRDGVPARGVDAGPGRRGMRACCSRTCRTTTWTTSSGWAASSRRCYDEVLMPDGSPGPLRFTRADLA